MKPEEQRIAIAEAFGWENAAEKLERGWCVPDYLHDLNAMHQAENEMTLEEKDRYAQCLTEMFNGPDWRFALIHADASQRAEAFLRTLNLWTE